MPSTMGSRIAGRRVTEQWTQKELAELVGISPKYLSRVETGAANPSAEVIRRIAESLRSSLDYIVEGRGPA